MLLPAGTLLAAVFLQGAPQAPEQGAPSPEAAEALQVFEEVWKIMDRVRDGFRRASAALEEARGAADGAGPDDAPVRGHLRTALAEADQLVADLEELLQKLPEWESQCQQAASERPDGGGPSGGANQPRERPPGEEPSAGEHEVVRQEDASAPPPEAEKVRILFDPRFGAWGDLPVRLQQALEHATSEDMPLRYRRWLEEYYRRATSGAP